MRNQSRNTMKFEMVYVSYYSRLKRFAKVYVTKEADAENIVQDIFLNLWEKQNILSEHRNLEAFLYTSVKNRCLDFLRHLEVVEGNKTRLQKEYNLELQLKIDSLETFSEEIFLEVGIEVKIQKAIESLPKKCREIFILNKIKGKKQKDIAKELNISIHTVENQIAIAYKKLKLRLAPYL